jgi:hypothetical protein
MAMNSGFGTDLELIQQAHALRSAVIRKGAQRIRAAVLRWWQNLWLDERAAYLSQATSHVELERRVRLWDGTGRDSWTQYW